MISHIVFRFSNFSEPPRAAAENFKNIRLPNHKLVTGFDFAARITGSGKFM